MFTIKKMAPRNTALTIKQKLLMISLFKEKEKTKNQLALEFKCDISTINRILRNEAKIRALADSNKNVHLKRYRKSSHTDIEKALKTWLNEMSLQNAVISSQIILNKAKEFAVKMNSTFQPNCGWLWRWLRRENIKFTKKNGKRNEKDNKDALNYLESSNFLSILKNYTPENIFSANESGLFYKALPNEMFARKEDQTKDIKSQKQRITLLFLCNSVGTYKKVFTIGKLQNPRCFNGNSNLPIPYFSNKNAWMTNSLWITIMEQFDKEMIEQNRKVLLFVSNSSCPKISGDLQNVNVHFLSPNTTGLLQPFDQGIIHSFKSNYRQIMIRKQIISLEKGIQMQNFIKSITILDALYFTKRAWWLVKEDTIINCFHKAGFSIQEQLVDKVGEILIDATTVTYNLEEYTNSDRDLQCHGLVADEKILDELSNNSENSEDEVVVKEELIIPSFREALVAIDVLRQYFAHKNYEAEQIENLETIIVNNQISNISQSYPAATSSINQFYFKNDLDGETTH